MRVLITGIGGFVGRHLLGAVQAAHPDAQIFGTHFTPLGVQPPTDTARLNAVTLHAVDLRDADATRALLQTVQPDQVYHLAGMAAVGRSFHHAWDTLENNIRCQLNLILAALTLAVPPRMLAVTSGEIYGAADADHLPTGEDAPLRPTSPYSVSKIAQDMLALQYAISHGLPIVRARPFNHTGPGQNTGFVAPDFAMQIARIEAGSGDATLRVGNLAAQRDFTDVRDVVRAYVLLMVHGTAGEVYNIASGTTVSIQRLLDTLMSYATCPVQVERDPERMRPSGIPILWGDASRLHAATGWQPDIPLAHTLRDLLDDCRQRVRDASST